MKLNTGAAQTEQLSGSMEIERVYVSVPGRGVGEALLARAVEAAREAAVESLWLGVWERNPRAIAFYEREGFEAFGRHDFMMAHEPQADVLMRLTISNRSESTINPQIDE